MRERTAELRRWIEVLGEAGDLEIRAGADGAITLRTQRVAP